MKMRIPNALSIFLATLCIAMAADDKRAPSGFVGMRGKKSNELSYTQPPVEEPTFRNVDLLQPEPKYYKAPENTYFTYPDPNKRTMKFFGMRGKKDIDDYEKRAPNGFLGMRGKKDIFENTFGFDDKRAPSGFLGMRGKKELDDLVDEEKRASATSFFGMRGKKQPMRSGFFGMRGKKYPYEFRGKFVGVRGKKISNEVTNPLYINDPSRFENGLDINQLMLLLTENEAGYVPEQETAFNDQDY